MSLTVSKSLDVNLNIKTRYSFGLCSALPFHNFTNSFYGLTVFVFSDFSDKVTAALLHRLPKSITKMLFKSFVFERNSVK